MKATLNTKRAAGESPAASGRLPDLPRQTLQFFPAQEVADALGVSKKTVHRRADALRWPRERVGCGFHYCVSADVAARIAAARAGEMQNEECKMQNEGGAELAVKFEDIANDERQARKVGLRQAAVEMCASFRDLGREAALALTVQRMREEHPALNICVRSLRDWCQAYAAYGVNGLVEQKRGIVGRHGVEVPTEFANLGKALVIERGSRAMAARELATHPDLPAGMRLFLHSGHATKSYVTPSIARAISPAVLTKDLIQGPKNARLKGRWTPGDYSQCRAGDFFVSDDMTSNVLCWCEWPNAQGWRIGQAQILPVMDVRALRWLNVRVIMRDGGQYNAQDDIWGLFGDVFDTFGLPAEGFVLEGGSWQSNVIRGVRTGLDADNRVDLFAEPAPEIETAATVAPSPAGAVGPVAPAQARGVREAVRAVVAGFGGRQFNLHEVRAKLPEPLREKATAVLCHLAQIGELVKTRRARWMQAPASGVAATNAGPQPGTVLENADGTKSYVLEPDTESGDAGGADARPGTGKYWALWKKVEARKTGMSRFALTRRTIGRVCKPQEMTAGELGKMIEVFLAILRESKGVEAVGATAGMGAV